MPRRTPTAKTMSTVTLHGSSKRTIASPRRHLGLPRTQIQSSSLAVGSSCLNHAKSFNTCHAKTQISAPAARQAHRRRLPTPLTRRWRTQEGGVDHGCDECRCSNGARYSVGKLGLQSRRPQRARRSSTKGSSMKATNTARSRLQTMRPHRSLMCR